MKRTTNGFGVVEGLLIVAVIGLIGAVGYIVYDKMQDKDDKTDTAQTTQKKTDEEKIKNPIALDTTIHDVDITLKTEADLAKLPSQTPDSFREYLASELRSNTPIDAEYLNGAVIMPTIAIDKISQFNVRGGRMFTTENNEAAPGGAPVVWVLDPSGGWSEETRNGPTCVSKNGGKIYEEFVAECYDAASDAYIANPNGSITTINKR